MSESREAESMECRQFTQAALEVPATPLVSVLMLAYNHERHLAQAIDSVLQQQTDFPVELLIGEDCSSDRTREIALEYQARHPKTVRVITDEINVGAYRNYLRLLDAARGQFLAHIDGDDYWLPGKLARQVSALHAHPECTAVYSNAIVVDDTSRKIGMFNDANGAIFTAGDLLRHGNFLNTSTMVFRASQLVRLQRIGHEYIDFQTHLTLAEKGPLLHLGEPLAAYRFRSGGSMIATGSDKVRELYWQAILDLPRGCVNEEDLARGIGDFLRRVLVRSVFSLNPSLFLDWWARAVVVAPCSASRLAFCAAASLLRNLWKFGVLEFRLGRSNRTSRVLYHQ